MAGTGWGALIMGISSKGWKDDPHADSRSPYVSWWVETGINDSQNADEHLRDGILTKPVAPPKCFTNCVGGDAGAGSDEKIALSLPEYAYNPEISAQDWDETEVGSPDFTAPPKDSVIVGIIDTGIALSHSQFRKSDGTTRFLASWQQSAIWSGQQNHLPFGDEVFQQDINRLMVENTAANVIDEDGFNRACGLSNMTMARGQRDVDHDASHGTHVLDLASGFDPKIGNSDRLPIIAVNLPTRSSIGASGSFLQFFVIHAIARIIDIADATWRKHYRNDTQAKSFPIVINLSYGLHAGPKDGTLAIERFMAGLIKDRKAKNLAPLRFVLPAGNDNLSMGHVHGNLPKDSDSLTVPWRTQPEDQTSNYVEIWSDKLAAQTINPVTNTVPVEISVTAPDGTSLAFTAGRPDTSINIGNFGRIYCRTTPLDSQNNYRVNYVICTAPTLSNKPDSLTAPAGLWEINLKYSNPHESKAAVDLFVQSDQTVGTSGATGLLSYFDHKAYNEYDDAGIRLDTDAYPFVDTPRSHQDFIHISGPVQRKGTLNAIATFKDAIVLAGHRNSDGKPAGYSSTGGGFGAVDSDIYPTASFPTDDGAMHLGILGAGAKSASTASFQGTSFATALATRTISLALLAWRDSGADVTSLLGSASWLKNQATTSEVSNAFNGTAINPLKSGSGRMESQKTMGISRLTPF